MKYIVKIVDGLGNQMFTYAWARTMQKLYGGQILLDPHSYKKNRLRSLSLTNFILNENVTVVDGILDTILTYGMGGYKKVIDFLYPDQNLKGYKQRANFGIYEQGLIRDFNESWIHPKLPISYVEGRWMSEQCFLPAINEVRHDLRVKTKPSLSNQLLIEEVQNCESVCMHVRLGDFLQEPWNSMSRVCGNDYYNEAIRIICEKVDNPVFYLFSNRPKDFEYIRDNFKFDVEVRLMNLGNPDFEDLRLMYSCKHQISSNSTFSWWAQYLNDNPNKVVVAPSMHNKHNKWNLQYLFQDSWELVGPEFLLLDGMTATKEMNSISPKIDWNRVVQASQNKNKSKI